jgi:hypothetical protein
VNFEYFNKIIISDSRQKSNFNSVLIPKTINSTSPLDKTPLWIFFANGVIRIGLGIEISLEKELISYTVSPNSKLKYFSIDKGMSYNAMVNEVLIISPQFMQDSFLEYMNRDYEVNSNYMLLSFIFS